MTSLNTTKYAKFDVIIPEHDLRQNLEVFLYFYLLVMSNRQMFYLLFIENRKRVKLVIEVGINIFFSIEHVEINFEQFSFSFMIVAMTVISVCF